MTIEKWLSDVYYDEFGTHIWNREDKDGGSQLVAEIRGWGRLQNEFPTLKESEKFQDEVGEFIVQAIREKIARTSSQTEISDEKLILPNVTISSPQYIPEISDEEIEKTAAHHEPMVTRRAWISACKWYREQLKNKV